MFGKRLKDLRRGKGMTIYEIADELEIGRSTYAGYETEHRKPPLETLAKIAKFHEVSTDYILGLTDDKDIKRIEKDAREYLNKSDLTWNGIPLSDEELKPIRDLLEVVVKDRVPTNKKKPINNTISHKAI